MKYVRRFVIGLFIGAALVAFTFIFMRLIFKLLDWTDTFQHPKLVFGFLITLVSAILWVVFTALEDWIDARISKEETIAERLEEESE